MEKETKEYLVLSVFSTIWYWAVLWYSRDLIVSRVNFLPSILITLVISIVSTLLVLRFYDRVISRQIKTPKEIVLSLVPAMWIFIVSVFKIGVIGLVNYSVIYNIGSGLLIGFPLSLAVYYARLIKAIRI